MKVDRVQCLVRMNYDGNPNLTVTVKSGPTAAYAFEIPLMRRMNDLGLEMDEAGCCISEAQVVGSETTSTEKIRAFLRGKYKQHLIDAIYPGGRGYALTLADCELPDEALAKKPFKTERAEAAAKVA